ncbi:MAG: hypothetical protein GWO86_04305 [Planctomycetes bacterium]|nr:hypothetical protein [Planctomycetota bacterium]
MHSSKSRSISETVAAALKARRGDGTFALRMAPMIDMIFLLLIFFLVTADFRPQEDFLPFQLPPASAATLPVGHVEPLAVYIADSPGGCQVRIGDKAVEIRAQSVEEDLAVLIEKLRDVMNSQRRTTSDAVEIVCLPEVKWDYLAKIYNVLYGFGMTDITFRMTE